MALINGELDLSQISKSDFKSDMELRVAAVREGKVLGSTVVQSPSSASQRVSFAVEFEPVGVVPCPVTLVVGPNFADREFLNIDTVKRVVDFPQKTLSISKSKDAKTADPAGAIRVDVGAVAIDPAIYLCWIVCCRQYTIRGRVVCRQWSYNPQTGRWFLCDSPVPGAKVNIYDVNCFLWWCWRSVIGTATTDVNGNFTFTFQWCCFRWFPWLDVQWTLDGDLYRRIAQLLATANISLPPVPPPAPDPAVLQSIFGSALAASSAGRRLASAPGTANTASSLSADVLLKVLPRSAELEALHVWPWWPWGNCGPNVVFEATQFCNDRYNVIYSESNSQTRWDIPNSLGVTLIANDLACCVPTCRDPECPDCLKLTWVCNTPTSQISADAGPPDLRGFANTLAEQDLAFTGALQIRGAAGVDYFKVQWSIGGGPFADMPTPVFGGFSRSYWDGTSMVPVAPPGFTPQPKSGQIVMITREHYEVTHPAIPRWGPSPGEVIWNDYDTLFYFNTVGIADGLYQLQLVGYDADSSDNLILSSARVLPTCGEGTAEKLYLRVDNNQFIHPPPTPTHPCGSPTIHFCTNEPDCWIRSICKNEGTPEMVCVSACDIVHMKQDDTLTIHFSATCPSTVQDGHLAGYTLDAEYGVSQILNLGLATAGAPCPTLLTDPRGTFEADPTTIIGPDYATALTQGAPRPQWYGGGYKVTLRGCDFPESCAYLFRLCAWKRTTNGCTTSACYNLDYNQFEVSLTIVLD
jgi:hypothetical protein